MLFTGINLFKTGNIITNLNTLNEQEFKYSYIDELIKQKTEEKASLKITETEFDFHKEEINKLLKVLQTSHDESELPENVRNSYKLTRIIASAYSKDVLKHEFILPVSRSAEDRQFIDEARKKLVLENSPFSSIEKRLNITISPKKLVYLPIFKHYLLFKQDRPRGNFYEFVTIDRFLLQLNKSNPFCLLALFNADHSDTNELLIELTNQKEKIITRKIYDTFKGVATSLFTKVFKEDDFNYDPNIIISMIALLVYLESALKTGEFSAEFTPYFSMFESIYTKNYSKENILFTYNELITAVDSAIRVTCLETSTPDEELLESTAQKIKHQLWLSESRD